LLELRRFEDADAAAVRELHDLTLAAAATHARPPPPDPSSIRSTYLDGSGEFLVGVTDGRLVAMGALRHVTDTVAEPGRMCVHPSFQRRGFGRLLLRGLEDRAAELGFRRLRLDTTVMQTAAQGLYRSAGYREVGRGQLAGVEVVYFAKALP
jgi:ribosomal protein S18 acetylase RimI-like enzyme